MNRIVGYISNEIEKKLRYLIDISHFEIDYADKLGIIHTTKKTLIDDGFVSLRMLNNGRFEALVNNGNILAESLLADFIVGYRRVREQHENLVLLIRHDDFNPAWALVTAYYCSFFCSIDLLRIFNRVNLGFDEDDYSNFYSKISGDKSTLSGNRNYVGVVNSDCQKIVFSSSGDKPHKIVWPALRKHLIDSCANKKDDWTEFTTLQCILSGERNWEFPSDVRNKWNYKRIDYYHDKGSQLGIEFRRIIGDSDRAVQWLSSNFYSRGETHHAASIAVLCEILFSAIDNAYKTVFT